MYLNFQPSILFHNIISKIMITIFMKTKNLKNHVNKSFFFFYKIVTQFLNVNLLFSFWKNVYFRSIGLKTDTW